MSITRSTPHRNFPLGMHVVFSILCAAVAGCLHCSSAAGQPPADRQTLTDEQRKQLLAERDRLLDAARKFDQQDKSDEAIEAGVRMLEIERQLVGNNHEIVLSTINWLAERYERREDVGRAEPLRKEALSIAKGLYEEQPWKVADARVTLATVQRLAELDAGQQKQLRDAEELNSQVVALYRQGQYGEAARLAEQALRLRQEILGYDARDTAASLNNLAFLYNSMGDYAKAEPLSDRALQIHKKVLGEEHPDTATSLNNLAGLYRSMGDYAKAEPLYQQALQINRKVLGEEDPHTAAGLNNLAALYYAMSDYAKAEPLQKQALEIRRKVLGEEHPDTAQSLNNLASLYESMGDYAKAEALYQQGLQINRKVLGEEHPDTATSLSHLAGLYRAMGDYARAAPLYEQGLQVNRKVLGREHPDTARTLSNLATTYDSIGNYRQAELLCKQALEIRTSVLGKDHPSTANCRNNLAVLYPKTGDFRRAELQYKQSLELFERTLGHDHPDTAAILNNLASLYHTMGDFRQAELLYRKCLEIRMKVLGEAHDDSALTLNNLAALYEAMCHYGQAEPLYKQSLEIWRRILGEEHPLTANCLNNLAYLYVSMEHYEKAEPLFQQSLKINMKVLGEEHPSTATSLNNLANLYRNMGDEIQGKALRKESTDAVSRIETLTAALVQATEKYSHAESLYKQSLQINTILLGAEHPTTANSLTGLGGLYISRGQYERAEPFCHEALGIALKHLELSAGTQSNRQQLAMTRRLWFHLDNYLTLAATAEQYDEAAYRQLLAWKGIVLSRQRSVRAVYGHPEHHRLYEQLQNTIRELAQLAFATSDPATKDAWQLRLAQLSGRKAELERQLADSSTAYRQAKRQVTLHDVRVAIPSACVLVDFIESSIQKQNHLLACVVRRERPVELLELGLVQPLARAIDIWRIDHGSSTESQAAAQLLRKRIWEPIETILVKDQASNADLRAVLVSPDGVLARFPLGALPGSEPRNYLLEEWPIAIVAAPQMLPSLLEDASMHRNTTGDMLVLGGVDYDFGSNNVAVPNASEQFVALGAARRKAEQSFAPLPGTRDEIAAIQQIYRGNFRSEVIMTLEGKEASEEALRRCGGEHRYLHLATHGFFAPEKYRSALDRGFAPQHEQFDLLSDQSVSGYHPSLLSGLVLAGANNPDPNEDDGILTAAEVSAMNLDDVELVVLSACETGLGSVAGGEGLLGLQRAFEVAGARTVVASLWKVPDAATCDLMERFYNNLWDKKMGKLEALRQAQLAILNGETESSRERGPSDQTVQTSDDAVAGRAPPRLWAAWVLSGDPGDLSAIEPVQPSVVDTPNSPQPTNDPSASTVEPTEASPVALYLVTSFIAVVLLAGVVWIVIRRRRTSA